MTGALPAPPIIAHVTSEPEARAAEDERSDGARRSRAGPPSRSPRRTRTPRRRRRPRDGDAGATPQRSRPSPRGKGDRRRTEAAAATSSARRVRLRGHRSGSPARESPTARRSRPPASAGGGGEQRAGRARRRLGAEGPERRRVRLRGRRLTAIASGDHVAHASDTPGLTEYLTRPRRPGRDARARQPRDRRAARRAMMQSRPDQGAAADPAHPAGRRAGGGRGRDVHRLRGDLHRPRARRGRAADVLRGRRALARGRARQPRRRGRRRSRDGRGRPGRREPGDAPRGAADRLRLRRRRQARLPRLLRRARSRDCAPAALLVLDNTLLGGRVRRPARRARRAR